MTDYFDETYRANRVEAFTRDKFTCQGCSRTEEKCKEAGDWLEAHHKALHYIVGKESIDDLLTLCNICHGGITNARRFIRHRGYHPPDVPAVLTAEKIQIPEMKKFDVPVEIAKDSQTPTDKDVITAMKVNPYDK